MGLRELKDRIASVPWVYDTLRQAVIGGLNYAELARFCQVGHSDRVFDLGCGTGQLAQHLCCAKYLGVDLDSSALQRARRFASENKLFMEGDEWDGACREVDPTVVLMIGLVHHVPDDAFKALVQRLKKAAVSLSRIVTFDSTYFPGHPVNNFLSRMDRGRYVRAPAAYERLFENAGLRVLDKEVVPTMLRHARYLGYHLTWARIS